ncbi:MAG: ATP-dependent Clp protease ATP-binding subunit, partial [Leptolyngbyaceae cyanobacterium MO_188.B28]|nr:ATP-dependent Clp protease ATP-binding subunit [Leptolyngbyaceae cyanobacterium MO_188.B28]
MFEHFSSTAIAVILQAQEEARRLGHSFVGTEQLLLGLIREGSSIAAKVLADFGMTLSETRAQIEAMIGRGHSGLPNEIPFTPKVKQVFEQAFQEARRLDYPYIEPEHLLISLTQNTESVAYRVLEKLGIEPAKVRIQVIRAQGELSAIPSGGPSQLGRMSPFQRSTSKALEEFGVDLTQLAAAGKLDPIVGRHPEIERVIQILGRRTKNNPVLVGEPGVGKTAIAEGLAQRIVNQEVPEPLLDQRVITLDMGLLIAGARFRGDFEERLTQILTEVRQAKNIILVIDEIHTIVGAGSLEGGMDAANLMKPALARGELQCIGATTLDEYRKRIERDAALERRFQSVMVNPPSVDETIDILSGLRGRYEQFHHLTIADDALEAAAKFSDRYITDRHLPDKAIDLIDEAGSRVRLRHSQRRVPKELKREMRQVRQAMTEAIQRQDFVEARKLRQMQLDLESSIQSSADTTNTFQATLQQPPEVNVDDIADIVASWTGIPVNRLTESESALLTHLDDTLHQRLIGQEEAVMAVTRAIRRARVGLSSPNRPIASLIFSGPTGVGKTELAKALAATVFGSESAMVRLDMSEYMEAHTISKLIGSPPGFVGYE